MNRDLSAKELFAYSFARNMGTADRIFRVVSGLVLAAAGFALGLSPLASAPMAVAGLACLAPAPPRGAASTTFSGTRRAPSVMSATR